MNTILQKRIEEAAIKASDVCEPCDYGDPFCASCHRPYMYDAAKKMGEIILNNQWISVEEALPPLDDGMESVSIEVVVKNEYGKATCAWYSYITNTWHLSYGEIAGDDVIYSKITHWTPIPSLEGGEE